MAMIIACGGLMIASNCLIPYMPMLLKDAVPPWYSCGASLPSRARAARSFISEAIALTVLLPASATIGVIRPPGIETATEMSARLYLSRVSPVNWTLHAGTCSSAWASALISRSLTESLTPRASSAALSSLRSFDVGLDDAAVGAAALHGREIDALVGGDALGERRGDHAVAGRSGFRHR